MRADDNYLSEADRARAQILILQKLTKKVNIANGGTSTATNATPLPIPRLLKDAAEAHTFKDSRTSQLSVGKVSDGGNVSIFKKQGVKVHKEEDVLITGKGQTVIIGKRDTSEADTKYHLSNSAASGNRALPPSEQIKH